MCGIGSVQLFKVCSPGGVGWGDICTCGAIGGAE